MQLKAIASSGGGNSIAQRDPQSVHSPKPFMITSSFFYLFCVILACGGCFVALLTTQARRLLAGFMLSSLGISGLLAILGSMMASFGYLLLALALPSSALLQFFFPLAYRCQGQSSKGGLLNLSVGCMSIALAILTAVAIGLRGRHGLLREAAPSESTLAAPTLSPLFITLFLLTAIVSVLYILSSAPPRALITSNTRPGAKAEL